MLRHRGTTVQVEAFMLDADTHLPNAIMVPHDQNVGRTKVKQQRTRRQRHSHDLINHCTGVRYESDVNGLPSGAMQV